MGHPYFVCVGETEGDVGFYLIFRLDDCVPFAADITNRLLYIRQYLIESCPVGINSHYLCLLWLKSNWQSGGASHSSPGPAPASCSKRTSLHSSSKGV